MANHYYGASLGVGTDPSGVTVSTSTTTKKVELVIVDATTGLTGNKMEILKAIDAIRAKVLQGDAPA